MTQTTDEELMHEKMDTAVDDYLDRLDSRSVSAKYADEHYIEGFIAGWEAARKTQ